ncbi:twin-arginine translocation signal domain-containing protein [Ruegeria meonggei]
MTRRGFIKGLLAVTLAGLFCLGWLFLVSTSR